MYKDILDNIDQKAVLEKELGIKIILDKKIKSPFRKDNNPDCWFTIYNGKLMFVDHSKKTFDLCSVDIIEIIKRLLKGSYSDVKRHLEVNYLRNNAFNNPIKYEKHNSTALQKEKALIKVIFRKYNDIDQAIWKDYSITIKQLLQDNVYTASEASVFSKKTNEWFTIKNDHMYCFYEFKPRKKLYLPYPQFHQRKFYTDTDSNYVGNIDKFAFKKNDYLIITKSYKDCRILRNFGFNTIWFQSESQFPKSYILDLCLKDTKKIYILFDNDEPGIKNSLKLFELLSNMYPNKQIHNFKLPIYKNLTDCGDYMKFLNHNNMNTNRLKKFILKELQ